MVDRVGVRELRQNLSVYLRRVQDGEELEVTDRGRPVALLVPLPACASALERLVLTGRARAAEGSLANLAPPSGRPSESLSLALEELRGERL